MWGMGGFNPQMLQQLLGQSGAPGGFLQGGGIGQGPMGRGLQISGPTDASMVAQNPMSAGVTNPLMQAQSRLGQSQGLGMGGGAFAQSLPQQRDGGMPIVQQGGPQAVGDRQRRKPQLY